MSCCDCLNWCNVPSRSLKLISSLLFHFISFISFIGLSLIFHFKITFLFMFSCCLAIPVFVYFKKVIFIAWPDRSLTVLTKLSSWSEIFVEKRKHFEILKVLKWYILTVFFSQFFLTVENFCSGISLEFLKEKLKLFTDSCLNQG